MEDITIHLSGRNYSLLHNEIFHLLRGADAVNAFAAGAVSAAPRGALAPGTRGALTAARAHTGHPVGSRFCLWPRAAATRHASFHDLAFRGIGVRPLGELAMGTWPLVTTGSGVVFRVPHVLHRVPSLASQIQLLKAAPPTPPLLAFD